MGRWKALGPISLALVIAAISSYFIYSWMQQQTISPNVVTTVTSDKSDAVKVAVAAVDVVPGTKLSSEMIKKESFLEKSLPPGYFTDPTILVGRVTIASLKANEPITEHRLASIDIKTGGISALVNDGKRAVAVGGDKVIGLSGFIYPGNHVDVLVTWQDPNTEKEITKVVLENVLVLASGTLMQKNDKGEAAPVDVYTLELTPEESEILGLTRNEGKIQFALRNPTDSGSVPTNGATYDVAMTHLQSKSPSPQKIELPYKKATLLAPVQVQRATPAKTAVKVEIIKEGQLTTHTF
jgi:pilus assembly protein CpaB